MTGRTLSKRSTLAFAFAILVVGTQRSMLSSIHEKHRLSSVQVVTHKPSIEFHDRFPLYIGAGQGTTGTRTTHKACCKMGIPSVHYNNACYRSKNIQTNSSVFTPNSIQRGLDAHMEVIVSWKKLSDCVKFARSRNQECTSAIDIIANMTEQVAQVVSSGIGAIHDVPYTHMVPFIMSLSKRERGVDPVLLLTTRNPGEWASRRVEQHQDTPQLVCNDTNGAFDFQYCLEKESSNTANLLFAYSNCQTKQEKQDYVSKLEETMDRYQTSIGKLSPDFEINMFDLESKLDLESLTQMIWDATQHKLSRAAVDEMKARRQQGGLDGELKMKGNAHVAPGRKRRPNPHRLGIPARSNPYARISRARRNLN